MDLRGIGIFPSHQIFKHGLPVKNACRVEATKQRHIGLRTVERKQQTNMIRHKTMKPVSSEWYIHTNTDCGQRHRRHSYICVRISATNLQTSTHLTAQNETVPPTTSTTTFDRSGTDDDMGHDTAASTVCDDDDDRITDVSSTTTKSSRQVESISDHHAEEK